MQTIATNIRLPLEDYEDLRTLAFHEKTSLASMISAAIKQYKFNKLKITRTARMSLFEKMKNSRIKVKTSTVDLIREGRKFE